MSEQQPESQSATGADGDDIGTPSGTDVDKSSAPTPAGQDGTAAAPEPDAPGTQTNADEVKGSPSEVPHGGEAEDGEPEPAGAGSANSDGDSNSDGDGDGDQSSPLEAPEDPETSAKEDAPDLPDDLDVVPSLSDLLPKSDALGVVPGTDDLAPKDDADPGVANPA